MRDNGLHVGFAFDGDADRCLAVDERGEVVNGDGILYVYARFMKERGNLPDNTVVTTIMSNFGLYKALDDFGISYKQTDVGDRYVYECMRENGHLLGGEQSGHIIFSQYATTGDGVLTALKMMQAMIVREKPLSQLVAPLEVYPQVLKNVRVKDKQAAMDAPEVQKAVADAQEKLGREGRVLLRKSGTEPVLRVMAEAATHEKCEQLVSSIIDAIHRSGHAAAGA